MIRNLNFSLYFKEHDNFRARGFIAQILENHNIIYKPWLGLLLPAMVFIPVPRHVQESS